MPEQHNIVRVAGVTKSFELGKLTVQALKGVDLTIKTGEYLSIMGPSGSGKSTLLFILGIFQPATSGVYKVAGVDVLTLDRAAQAIFRREKMGFVFQSCDLLENSTVYENLELPLIYTGVKRSEREDKIMEALKRVNLEHRVRQPSNRLSGGERQRVSIARALVNEPEFILADEPTGQLDKDNSERVMDYFVKITDEARVAMVIVTHDAGTAARCSRKSLLSDGMLKPY